MLFEKGWSSLNNILHLNREEYHAQETLDWIYNTGKSCLNTVLNFGKIATKEYAKGIAIEIGSIVLSIGPMLLFEYFSVSPNMLFSSSTKYYFKKFHDENIDVRNTVNNVIINFLNISEENQKSFNTHLAKCFTGPLLEEIICRGIIQELMLRRLPKKVLERIAPDHTWVVDSMPAKLLRVGCASAIFALTHTDQWGTNGGTFPQLVCGIIYGTIVEKSKGNVLKTIFNHHARNSLLDTISVTSSYFSQR